MDRWAGRVAVVTGASSGMGAAIAYQLQDNGLNVVAVARKADKIEEAVKNARKEAKNRGRYSETKVAPGKLYAKKCDLGNEQDILNVFKWINVTLGGADILINNGGASVHTGLTDAPTADWKIQVNVNILGLSICTREAVHGMRARGVDDGHIVHTSSIYGGPTGLSMYMATKQAVIALTEGLRKDFVEHKSNMKVTCICPGLTLTAAIPEAAPFNPANNPDIPHLLPEDVADAIIYAIGTPRHVQIHQIIIKPVRETF